MAMAHACLVSRPLTLALSLHPRRRVADALRTRFPALARSNYAQTAPAASSLNLNILDNSISKGTRCLAFQSKESRRNFSSSKHRFVCSATPTQTVAKDEEIIEKGQPTEIFLKDYKPPLYAFEKVDLKFVLEEDFTNVTSIIDVRPLLESNGGPLFLNGEELELISIQINGQDLKSEDYTLTPKGLTLTSLPQDVFQLKIETKIAPQNNTSLEGLYKSRGNFCTQCEAEGFRKITFYQDRPDVMAKFVTRIEANKSDYPILLSNGNLIEEGSLSEDRHYAVWNDPFPKPSYLFALVAGKLFCNESEFVTKSNRNVKLRIWVNESDLIKTDYAMKSLIASMKWDEDVFGLEYDLDLFNIVAVPDFNMGAMENKSLNIFNSRLVLASPETATDSDYSAIEGVIAHEYFHNWTGNRVTCRDWFQLTLKEGLTVYRDQEFSADMNSRGVGRIEDVSRLRNMQFPQDAGPMAHPVRPDSYIKMDNFYTVTVYEKGAEIVRMYETLLGKDGFRKGMDLYFQRHDGQAVTCDDFLNAMSDANNYDLKNFNLWLSQAGTPTLNVKSSYDENDRSFTIHFQQVVPPTPGQPNKKPMLIPVKVGLIGQNGNDLKLSTVIDGDDVIELDKDPNQPTYTTVLRVEKETQTFRFLNIEEKPIPSLLRNFSSPVKVVSDEKDDDLYFRLANDSDEFNRWEAGNTIARKILLELISKKQNGEELTFSEKYIQALRSIITNPNLDKAFVAYLLVLPSENELSEFLEVSDPDAINYVRDFSVKQIAKELKPLLLKLVEENKSDEPFTPDHQSKARRSLKHIALSYLASLNEVDTTTLAVTEFKNAKNMTEQFSALAAVAKNEGKERDEALNAFYEQWKDDNLVMNKWLSLQASSSIENNVENVKKLLDHPAFSILEPNKVYALIGGFCSCLKNFHAKDGSGYQFLGDIVLKLDPLNAQVASRMVSAFTRWKKYDSERQALAKAQLERIANTPNLSDNVLEIVTKSLAS